MPSYMPDNSVKAIVQRMIDGGESEASIAAVIQHLQAISTPPELATAGMLPQSTPASLGAHDIAQQGMEYGLAGAMPEKTPGKLAAASAGVMALPALAAVGPEAIAAGATAARPLIKPVLKEVAKRAIQGAGAGATLKVLDKVFGGVFHE